MCDWCDKAINASRPMYTKEAVNNGVKFNVYFCTRKCEKAWAKDAEQYGTT